MIAPGSSFERAIWKSSSYCSFLGVEEDHVEDVVDRRQRLEGISRDQLGPLIEAGLRDVSAPGIDLRLVVFERKHAAAEVAHARREPDRRVPARTTDLEDFAVGLRRHEGEEEPAGRARDLASALFTRNALLTLAGVLFLQAGEHGADMVVEHSGTLLSR
jgi:hypothetical protein